MILGQISKLRLRSTASIERNVSMVTSTGKVVDVKLIRESNGKIKILNQSAFPLSAREFNRLARMVRNQYT